ncbi:MAG TPA: DivIVA domain-containing protein [Acidimicrobiales bacterium]|nr:DivIVA domain-containing protein [Acidimicrobiales bacterium]
MPDHRPIAIGSLSGLAPEEVAGRSFPAARRGLDPDAVRHFLEDVAAELRELRVRESSLREELAEAERRAADPELDDATLSAKVGSETARVLQAAHEAARELVGRAEARAATLQAEAETVLGERTEAADKEVRRLLAEAQARAEDLVEATKQECRAMVDEAREARRRILADLAAKRRELHTQLEQLRAGKDALAGVVASVASSVDAVRARLAGSEEEARAAAEEAGRYAPLTADEPPLEDLVAEALGAAPAEGAAEAMAPEHEPAAAAGEPSAGDDSQVPPELDAQPSSDEETPRQPEPAGETVQEPEAAEVPAAASQVTPGPADGSPRAEDGGPVDASAAGEEGAPGPEASGASPVDELFAKIRASRAEELAHARSVLEELDSSEIDEPGPEWSAAGGPPPPGEDAPGDLRAAPPGSGSDVPGALAARDELLAPVLVEVARAVKRVLRTDQNELLHALRQGGERSALLPGEEAVARLAGAVLPGLESAWAAGGTFAARADGTGDVRGGQEDDAGAPGDEAGEAGLPGSDAGADAASRIARELAEAVVATLRERLEIGLHAGDLDEAGLAELVGHAYREWKGERVDDVVGDYATSAFSSGLLAAAGARGLRVTWVVDDGRDECPDCDDNAIAGAQPVGEAFPTGQAHPPVHPGCRCLLLPVSA